MLERNPWIEHGEEGFDQAQIGDRDGLVISTGGRVQGSVVVVQVSDSASQPGERGVGTEVVHVPGPDSKVSDMSPLLPGKRA